MTSSCFGHVTYGTFCVCSVCGGTVSLLMWKVVVEESGSVCLTWRRNTSRFMTTIFKSVESCLEEEPARWTWPSPLQWTHLGLSRQLISGRWSRSLTSSCWGFHRWDSNHGSGVYPMVSSVYDPVICGSCLYQEFCELVAKLLVVWDQPWGEYLYHRGLQMLRISPAPHPSCIHVPAHHPYCPA